MVDEELSAMFARDVVLLKTLGIHPVIVHGGGPQIGKLLDRLGIVSEFKGGLRVTDEATMEVVEMVLSGPINKSIVRAINQAGGLAVGLSGSDGQLLQATKATKTERDPDSHIEQVLDLGFVGEPTGVDTSVIEALLKADSQLSRSWRRWPWDRMATAITSMPIRPPGRLPKRWAPAAFCC